MDALIIEGPTKLSGTVTVSGSKNTALPLLFSSLLFDREVTFKNVPRLWDIETTLSLLQAMGAICVWEKEEGLVRITPTIVSRLAPYEWVKKMRAGILALGPLIAKFGEAKVSLPGGCAIGARPVDFHIDALRKLGVHIEVAEGYIHATVPNSLRGAPIQFPVVTVTGTENLLYVAAVAEGVTVLENAAREPEVVALGEFLRSCGAKIDGLGTSRITITGGTLTPPKNAVEIPPDRIEAGTWIAASAVTGSQIRLEGCDAGSMESVLSAFREMGMHIRTASDGKSMDVNPPAKLIPVEIETSPYPGFPTDMQAQMITAMCFAGGRSKITENIFENRFMHVAELKRLGAKIDVSGRQAVVDGPAILKGAPLMATDLRASASLVLAGLGATGTTLISRIYHLDRGYQRLDLKLQNLGAKISRISQGV
jgi:UDP-N-acetylglucosamine 1-carboxyvinyltransferase